MEMVQIDVINKMILTFTFLAGMLIGTTVTLIIVELKSKGNKWED